MTTTHAFMGDTNCLSEPVTETRLDAHSHCRPELTSCQHNSFNQTI